MLAEKYCLYEASKDQWLGDSGQWISHRTHIQYTIPKEFELQSYGGGSQIDIQLVPSAQTDEIIVEDYTSHIDQWQVKKFDSVKEAEQYLYDNEHLVDYNGFVSVRKIYFK